MSKVFWKAFLKALGLNIIILGIIFTTSWLFLMGFLSTIVTVGQLFNTLLLEANKVLVLATVGAGATTFVCFVWSMAHKNIRDDGGLDESK